MNSVQVSGILIDNWRMSSMVERYVIEVGSGQLDSSPNMTTLFCCDIESIDIDKDTFDT